jgi:general L-amino acid transport system substrate-binding protein
VRRRVAAVLLALVAFGLAPQAEAGRLEQIRVRGYLTCGYKPGLLGFSLLFPDAGPFGLDADICRAVSVAILGSYRHLGFIEVKSFQELKTNPDIDLAVRRLSWTLTREGADGLIFGPITFYDGQGFLVPKANGISTGLQLDGKRICVDPGESWAGTLIRYLKVNNLKADVIVTAGPEDSQRRLFSGKCDAYSADKSMLGAVRASEKHLDDSIILADEISKEPLAPIMREGDDQFFQIVRWTIFAMIEAEELGVTSKNVDAMLASDDPDIMRLLGKTPGNGKALGLSEDWAYQIIKNIGNYGEMFSRHVGADSGIKLDRGRNNLWTNGGLMYAPPLR